MNAYNYSGPAFPLYALFILYSIYLGFNPVFQYILSKLAPSLLLKEVVVFENLGPYFESLNCHDAKWTVKEEIYSLKNLGM